MSNSNSPPLFENIYGSDLSFPTETHFSSIPTYSRELESDSVEMVPETMFLGIESECDGVPLYDLLEIVPESESLVTESDYEAWRANGGIFVDELPPPLVRSTFVESATESFPIYESDSEVTESGGIFVEAYFQPIARIPWCIDDDRTWYLQMLWIYFPDVLSLLQ